MELRVLQPTYDFIPPPIESGSAYYFTTDSGIQYEVKFGRKQHNILNTSIVFGVLNDEFDGEEYRMTNKFEVYRVMSTIVKIVQRYIKLHPHINCYEFTGEPTEKEIDKEGRVRLMLYNRYLHNIFGEEWEVKHEHSKSVVSKKVANN